MSPLLDPADLAPLDRDKALASLGAGLRIAEVRDPDGADFAACYTMLDTFFGPRGEMEDRSALQRFVAERLIVYGEALEGTYHLVGVWKDEELVAVRGRFSGYHYNAVRPWRVAVDGTVTVA